MADQQNAPESPEDSNAADTPSESSAVQEPAPDETIQVETTREALEKWVDTRRIISREKRDLALKKEMLNEQIELIQNEIQSLRDKTKETETQIAELETKQDDLEKQYETLQKASASLRDMIGPLETQTLALLQRLPDPIREKVKPLSQRIAETPNEATKLSISERFQNIVGILNEVNKFNSEISVTSEVRSFPDGTSAEVTALYVGIGQGYYANASGTIAGVGTATEDGWVWTPANESAAEIAKAIAILKNEQMAAYIQLPIETK